MQQTDETEEEKTSVSQQKDGATPQWVLFVRSMECIERLTHIIYQLEQTNHILTHQ